MYDFIKTFSLPPFGLLVLVGFGLTLIHLGRKRFGVSLAWCGLALVYVLSTGAVSARLTQLVEVVPVLTPSELARLDAQAIVVLGAGANPFNPELERPSASYRSLYRLRYGAFLHRQTGLPILVSGGKTSRQVMSLGDILANDLRQSFQVPVKWVEGRSLNTFENAKFTAEVLRAAGVRRAFLVTESFHMRRAMDAFAETDLVTIPAPTGKRIPPPTDLKAFLPTINALSDSYYALHELLGRLWYVMRYGT